jgi:hypothetical protein
MEDADKTRARTVQKYGLNIHRNTIKRASSRRRGFLAFRKN